MPERLKYNCIFGGGGIRGMCYVGALRALKELNIEINSIAGSSVGAVFAALLAAGYMENEIKELFFDFNILMFKDININIFNNDISISKGEIFLQWLRGKIGAKVSGNKYNKNNESKITFKDLNKNLYILTLDLNTNTPFIFSKETTPDEEVALAVRASASLPGLMKPVNYDNMLLVDGDLIKSWPAWKIYDELNNTETRILEFRLEGSRDGSNLKNPMDYLNSIINTVWYLSTENIFNLYHMNDRYDFIVIDTKDIILFDFTINKETKENLVEKGYNTTKNYLINSLVEKKEKILSIYQKINKKINLLNKKVSKNNPDEALFIINDILSSMKEDTLYIDEYIYEKIKELKIILLTEIKRNFLFTKKINNIKEVKDKISYTAKLTEEKINEIRRYVTNISNKS